MSSEEELERAICQVNYLVRKGFPSIEPFIDCGQFEVAQLLTQARGLLEAADDLINS